MPLKFLSRFQARKPVIQPVIVVSGLPRSGTSMMMQILEAGGLQIMTDQLRTPDLDNPKGYYEFERVKKLKDGDTQWVKDAQGKVVKVISALLEYLPADQQYKVIFMKRTMQEVLASQKQMMQRRGEATSPVDDDTLSGVFQKHMAQVEKWLAAQPNVEVLYIQYAELLQQPQAHVQSIVEFLGLPLDAQAMAAVPDQKLYRQRS